MASKQIDWHLGQVSTSVPVIYVKYGNIREPSPLLQHRLWIEVLRKQFCKQSRQSKIHHKVQTKMNLSAYVCELNNAHKIPTKDTIRICQILILGDQNVQEHVYP